MNITAYKSRRLTNYLIPLLVILCIVLYFAMLNLEAKYMVLQREISLLDSRIDTLDDNLQGYATKIDLNALYEKSDISTKEIAELRQDLGDFRELFRQMFEPSQFEYMKTHKGK